MLLSQALDIWLERYKPSSRSINSHRLNFFLKFVAPSLPLADVSVHDVLRYERGLKAYRFIKKGKEKAYSPKTVRMHIISVKTFFNWCVKYELIESNPTRLMNTPVAPVDKTRDKVMEEKDLQILLAFVKTDPLKNAFVHFSYETACRTGEVCSLRISNLNLDRHFLWYDPIKKEEIKYYTTLVSGKTGEREVSFYEDTAKALRRWLIMRPVLDHDYVFVTRTGTAFNPNQAKQVMRRIREGIKKNFGHEVKVGNIQSMRKRMGYAMGDANTPQAHIQEKLGHRNPQTTMIYMPKDTASAFGRGGNFVVQASMPDEIGNKILSLKSASGD